jgi:hypothetical protein
MTRQEIDAVFERVRTWPEERQELAAAMLLELEAGGGDVYVLSDEERAAIEEAEAELDRGEVASDEEVKALFARYRSR